MLKRMAVWMIGTMLLLGSTGFAASGPANVLVVYNANSAGSRALAKHYQQVRGIPDANMVGLVPPFSWNDESFDTIGEGDYFQYVYNPLAVAYAQVIAAGGNIDYVVLCRNLPYKVSYTDTFTFTNPDGTQQTETTTYFSSLDGALMHDTGYPLWSYENNFYGSATPFSDFKTSTANTTITATNYNPLEFLVTRLDGWSWADADSLVTSALLPRFQGAGAFYNPAPTYDSAKTDKGMWAYLNTAMRAANAALHAAGFPTQIFEAHFANPGGALASYVSWGVFDPTYNIKTFENIAMAPGSLALLVEWGSAMNLRTAPASQSRSSTPQMAQLIHNGLTGGLADIDGFWDEYDPKPFALHYFLDGWNLADSLYSSLVYMGYQEIVLGDPLATYYGPGWYVAPRDTGIKTNAKIDMSQWSTTASANEDSQDFGASNNMKVQSDVGGTSNWGTGGGGGGSTALSPSWTGSKTSSPTSLSW